MKSLSIKLVIAGSCFIIGVAGFAAIFLKTQLPSVNSPKILLDDRNADDPSPFHATAIREWENQVLAKFNEKPLDLFSFGDECYRFVLLPTFARPLLVRVWRKDGDAFLATRRLDGDGGFEYEQMGKLTFSRDRHLSEDEWRALMVSIEDSEFWYLPTSDPKEVAGPDGAFWVLEGNRGGAIHRIERNTPEGGLRQNLELLLDMSGMTEEYEGSKSWH